MAGYSGTPLAKKLGIKDEARVLLLGAPAGFEATLEPLPVNVTIARRNDGKSAYDVIVLFCGNSADLTPKFDPARKRLQEAGGLWVAWPKKSSGVATDLTENIIRDFGLRTGLVDNKVCAMDDIWSGLRFVVRVKDRSKPKR